MKFSRAIVRSPGTNFSDGISTSTAGRTDYDQAMVQHTAYCQALESCGLDLVRLEADLRFPDSTFVEDAAVLVHEFAVVTNPGAKSRNGEKELILPVLKSLFEKVYSIEPPGTLDGGDICQVDNHFLIGLSERTNIEGGKQLSERLKEHGYSSDFVDCSKFPGLLHLKSGIAYLGEGIMVVSGDVKNHPSLASFQLVEVFPDEAYAANCVRINDYVLIAAGFSKFGDELSRLGYQTLPIQVSEFEKMDGGLSCLSLRF